MKRSVIGLLAVCFLVGGVLFAAEGKKKGRLPAGYGKLLLSDKQKGEVYKIQEQYQDKIQALQAQIKKLRAEEKESIAKILTPAQRARLKEISDEKTAAADVKPAVINK